MLLTVDIGNTSIKLGLYDNGKETAFAHYETAPRDYYSMIISFLYKEELREESVDKAIVSSVVPSEERPLY